MGFLVDFLKYSTFWKNNLTHNKIKINKSKTLYIDTAFCTRYMFV